MKKIIFICHSSYRYNKPFDPNFSITFGFLNHYLKENGYSTIRHSLYRGGESRIHKSGNADNYYKIPLLGLLPDPIRYVCELVVNFFILVFKKPKIVIAIDPLSCFIPSILWKAGYIKKVFFITPDFSEKRFKNNILNEIYFFIDKFCTFNSSKNIVCAQTVIDHKKNIYNAPEKIFFHMPNIPNPWVIEKFSKIQKIKNRIVYVGNISNQINFLEIFNSFEKAKNKVPDLSMIIIGSGDMEEELKKKMAEKNITNIKFLGQLNYEDTLKEIAKSEIGIAIYNGSFNYDKFRDSCKIREYQSLGVVPITTEVVRSNVVEIRKYKSGIILKKGDNLGMILPFCLEKNSSPSEISIRNNCHIYNHKYEDFYRLLIK